MLFLLPLGFFLGFPFPLSVRLMKQFHLQDYIHWMYGLNGIASVVGSAAAMIIGIEWGFSYALYLGTLLYGLIALDALLLPRYGNRYGLISRIVETSDQNVIQSFLFVPETTNSPEILGTPVGNSNNDDKNKGDTT